MKEATKIMIETGIIPASIAKMVEIWSPGIWDTEDHAKEARDKTAAELSSLVSKLSELLEKESEVPELKETDLELQNLIKASWLKASCETPMGNGLTTLTVKVAYTRAGKLVLYVGGASLATTDMLARRGNELCLNNGKTVMLTHVEPRYVGDKIEFYVCDVKERPNA
jgi:hypothetical protein